MPRLWILSDLHQEFTRDPEAMRHPATIFDPAAHAPDFDIAVLAGDIEVPLTRSIEWIAERFAGMPVVVTPGNHDFFNDEGKPSRTIDEIRREGRELADRHGIHLLDDSSAELDGVRFLGGTLWTDFASVGSGMSTTVKMRVAAGRDGMNDYKRIKRWSSKYPDARKRLRPEDTIALHKQTVNYLEHELAKPFAGPTAVVTHHSPHPYSLDISRHGTGAPSMGYCYASNLTSLIESERAPDLWVHAHLHGHVDYGVGRTRIVMNARGYAFTKADANIGFDPSFVIDLPAPTPRPSV